MSATLPELTDKEKQKYKDFFDKIFPSKEQKKDCSLGNLLKNMEKETDQLIAPIKEGKI